MTAHRFLTLLAAISVTVSLCDSVRAEDPPLPAITNVTVAGQQLNLQFPFYPSAQTYSILSAPDLNSPFLPDPGFLLTPRYQTNYVTNVVNGSTVVQTNIQAFYEWRRTNNTTLNGFYRLEVTPMDNSGAPMSTNSLLPGTVLNRLAYGPTPDELERVRAMGADNYIQEQLTPETISENLSIDVVNTNGGWQYVTATGTGSSSVLYVYLTRAGEGYIDDIKLVAGAVPEVGANLIRNGGFETALTTADWTVSTNHFGSDISTTQKHSGNSSLHMVASSGGETRDSSIWQTISPGLSSAQTYTLSYWFLPGSNITSGDVTVRLSGSGIVGTPGTLATRLVLGRAESDDLRAWHVLHAIRSKRQLLETLLQFFDNHFVTQYEKARDYFDGFYSNTLNPDDEGRASVNVEFRELQRWRQALLNPQCTFYDLLKISAESPAMIIYLDTVNSRGDGSNVANENYARELLELFTFGVDNGYDQNDIVQTSKAWTGWRLRYVDPNNEFNPFAPFAGGAASITTISNQVGVWAFNYRQDRHNNSAKTIFPSKTVPARFGAPWAGRNYQLALPARSGTNSIQDGYTVITHLANQPFTQEYLSVKLCRLFVHDGFPNPTTHTDLPEYQYYDYSRLSELTEEAQLVHACMLAWENGNPKGQIRDVLRVIFSSELFRAHAGSMHKVKTPFEFTVSTIRALRALGTNATYMADTDGYALRDPMNRMGSMSLFNRAEPDGWPEAGSPWISAGTLAERIRFVQSFCLATSQRGSGANDAGTASSCNPVGLLQMKLPSTSWRDAGAVADYFLGILYPGEGKANLELYRQAAINFLNTADLGTTSSPFSALTVSNVANSLYDNRVRGMVAMLMTAPRFHEQ